MRSTVSRSDSAPPSPRKRSPIYYGWIVVAITFAVGLVAAGVRSSPAVLITPLEAEFGWTRAELGTVVGINLFLFGLAAPVGGMLLQRFGLRRLMLAGIALYGSALAATVLISSVRDLALLWGVGLGVGTGATASVLQATVATRWFVARRGLVVGILGTATSTGQLIFIPILMMIVVTFGWRMGPFFMGLMAATMVIPVLLWMRNDPADIGLKPYGATDDPVEAAQRDAPAVGLRAATHTREFWLLCSSFFVCGATSNGLIGTHLLPHSIEHGIPAVMAASTVGIMGAMNFVGTLGSGWLTDKIDPRRLLAFYYTFRGVSLFILPFVVDVSGLLVFAIIFGLDWFATVPPTVTLTAQRFGPRSVATLYGWIFACHQFGAATAAAGAGWVRFLLGEYYVAFFAGATLCLMAAGLASLIRTRRPEPSPTAAVPAAA